jgi:hypothetical protein
VDPPQCQRHQRQHLRGVQPDEVRHPKVAVIAAPAGARQARGAVGRADGVRPSDRHLTSGAEVIHLGRGRPGHQPAGRGADDGQHHAAAERPAHPGLGDAVAEQRSGQHDGHDQHQQDPERHRIVDGGIQRRRPVEVAGGAAIRLEADQHDLQQ